MKRWAVTKRIEAGEDLKPARTEIISIHSREDQSGPPPLAVSSAFKDRYAAVEIADGAIVGMVKGGKVDAAGGYGWPAETDRVTLQIDEKPRLARRRR